MPETEDESNTPTDYVEFSNLLLNGQRSADEAGKSYFFTWRGYRACVASGLPKLTTRELNRRYKLAIDCINKEGKYFETTQMSTSGRSSSSSSAGSSSILSSESQEQELTQIPATQLPGNTN